MTGFQKNKPYGWFFARPAAGLIMTLALAACQSGMHKGEPGADATAMLQRVSQAGATCWIRSGDAQFRDFRLVPELDTAAGQPRVLLLPKNNFSGLPVLVIEASGSPAAVTVFGPLMTRSSGPRIHSDVQRWAAGQTSCA